MKILRIALLTIGFGAMTYAAFAANQMKTTEVVVADSNAVVATNQTYPFTLYIGDNLAGITNPLKSLHFTASGVYTGNGSVTLMIDNNLATAKAFTLPAVASPTPFEIDYREAVATINPASAGSYAYNLNFNPSGVSIYGLGIRMTETHQFVPPACTDGMPANEKVKTTETVVAAANAQLNTPQVYPVTLYIGDNLAGITNPLKSLHFTASGVYTGGGTLTFDVNGAGAKAFTLPDVGVTATPFEVDYMDATRVINPASAGSYSYNLNFTPGGTIVVYGLGIKMTETHQYKPSGCAGMPVYGDLVSAVFDSTGSADGAGYNSVLWKGTLGGSNADEGRVKFQFAAADAVNGPWNYIGGDTCASSDWFDPGLINIASANTPIELKGVGANAPLCSAAWNNKRYFRYKIRICSKDCNTAGTFTPTVNDVIVNWAP